MVHSGCAVGRNLLASIADGFTDPRVAVTGAGTGSGIWCRRSLGERTTEPGRRRVVTAMHSLASVQDPAGVQVAPEGPGQLGQGDSCLVVVSARASASYSPH